MKTTEGPGTRTSSTQPTRLQIDGIAIVSRRKCFAVMMDRLAEPNAPEISNETLIQIYDDNVFDCQGLSESTAHVGSIINIATAGMLQKCLSKMKWKAIYSLCCLNIFGDNCVDKLDIFVEQCCIKSN